MSTVILTRPTKREWFQQYYQKQKLNNPMYQVVCCEYCNKQITKKNMPIHENSLHHKVRVLEGQQCMK